MWNGFQEGAQGSVHFKSEGPYQVLRIDNADFRLNTGAFYLGSGGMVSLGALGFTSPNGSGSGVNGSAMTFTTGNGGGGNSRGGDLNVVLGTGTGTKRNGVMHVDATISAPEASFNPALWVTQTYTPSQAGQSPQAMAVQLTMTGDGTLVTGPSIAAIEQTFSYQGTGACGSTILYGTETLFSFDSTGTLTKGTGFQSNLRGTGNGTMTTGVGVRSSLGPFTANVTTLTAYEIGIDLSGTGVFPTIIGFDSRAIVKATNAGTDTTGGNAVQGAILSVPNQGGNSSGSDNNWALRISNNSGHGGGSAADGGTVNNYVMDAPLPDAAGAGGATGHTRNYGIRLTGDGGTGATGNGGVTNWAFMSQSLAQSGFAGPVGIGAIVSSALVDTGLAANTTLTVKPQIATTGSPVGILYTGALHTTLSNAETPDVNFNLTRTVQFTGTSTLATQRAIIIGQPTYTSDTATKTITNAVTLDIAGAPVQGTNVTLTNTYALRVLAGNIFIGGLLTTYNNIAVNGNGVPSEVKVTRPAAQNNSTVTLATYTTPASDGSYEIQANINVTVSTTVTMTVTCSYTDEANVARVLTLPFFLLAGTLVQSITTAQGNIAYSSMPITIRTKASTSITIATAGTVTAVTYTGEGIIKQLA